MPSFFSNASKPAIAVLVSGNGSNLQALIDAQASGRLDANIALVLSNRSDAFALARATGAGIEAICVSHRDYPSREAFDGKVVEELRQRSIEWVVFAGFMRIVTPVLLDAFPDRILNLHPSLLPAFPGTDAIGQALDYGVCITGCTVHFVTPEMDAGPIVAQRAVEVRYDDTPETLSERIHKVEHDLLVECVQAAVTGRLKVVTNRARRRAEVRPL